MILIIQQTLIVLFIFLFINRAETANFGTSPVLWVAKRFVLVGSRENATFPAAICDMQI